MAVSKLDLLILGRLQAQLAEQVNLFAQLCVLVDHGLDAVFFVGQVLGAVHFELTPRLVDFDRSGAGLCALQLDQNGLLLRIGQLAGGLGEGGPNADLELLHVGQRAARRQFLL